MGLSRFLVVVGLVAACGGGGGGAGGAAKAPVEAAPRSELAVPSISSPPKSGSQSFADALTAVDAGELERADVILREMIRQDPAKKEVSDLLGAIQSIGGRGGEVAPHLLANVKAKTVRIAPGTAAPPAAIAGSKARITMASQKIIGTARGEDTGPFFTNDPVSKLSDRLFHARGARGMAEMGVGALPKALPGAYAGKKLVMIVPHRTDPERWLLMFGPDIGRARYVALVGGASLPMVVDLGDVDRSVLHQRTHEIGSIAWAEADGDTLYVESEDRRTRAKESAVPRDSSITAIDMKTGNVLWHSAENVANDGSFVVTDDHIITSFEDSEKSRLVMLDRKTGGIAATLSLPMRVDHAIAIRGLYVKEKKLHGRAYVDDVIFNVDDGGALKKMPDHSLVTTESLANLLQQNTVATKKIERHPLSAAAIERRAKAVAEMSEHPFGAVVALRDLVQFGEAAGNLATETLLETASTRLKEMREQAIAKVEAAPVLKIEPLMPGAGRKPAPVTHRLPPFRLKKTAEMISKTFLDSFEDDFPDLPQMAIDKPWPGHLGDLPEFMPAQMPSKKLLFDAYFSDGDEPKNANAIIGVYAGLTVLFDTKKRAPDRRLDFSAFNAPAEWPQTGHMELSGSVAFAIIASSSSSAKVGGASLLCFDRKTGETYWMIEDSGLVPRLVIDGYVVALTSSKKGRDLSDIVILDGVNGKELSRESGLKVQSILRLNEKELRAGSFTSRFSFEIVRP